MLVAAPGADSNVHEQNAPTPLALHVHRQGGHRLGAPPLPDPLGEVVDEFTIAPGTADDIGTLTVQGNYIGAGGILQTRVAGTPQAPVADVNVALDAGTARRDQQDMMSELRSMKGMIEERFGALAFMQKLQRQPAQARLTQKLIDCGFSPALIRKLAEGMGPEVTDEMAWASSVLERNLLSADREPALEDQGGVFALVGATGVGKTTSTAKLAAAFASKHGAANLGLITLDAYRVAAHEQLRTYGRILGVPVHTAHDRASLEDLLDLLSAKKMVLIDTAGMAQRDTRTRELLDMLSHRSIHKLLVVNSAAQGETIEDVLISYHASTCRGIVLSKMDEAVKLGPALDALIASDAKIETVSNGGYSWSEGPVWYKGRIVFSDVPNNVAYQWIEGDAVASVFLKPSGTDAPSANQGSNGLAVDGQGRMLLCQHGSRRVARLGGDEFAVVIESIEHGDDPELLADAAAVQFTRNPRALLTARTASALTGTRRVGPPGPEGMKVGASA